ncbi:hypothetical protein CYMTET_27318 [Cymbomonas tetramitiformis]|uniref:Uncharacterized protein n=1 Tax=Cymbomonas tetramitiformis TaxID=36881 RepID=A0AAE0FQM5_9CHLO|nr:hypothetical protein CYMTET_27318 [Cymbomonas tetramitiformis]
MALRTKKCEKLKTGSCPWIADDNSDRASVKSGHSVPSSYDGPSKCGPSDRQIRERARLDVILEVNGVDGKDGFHSPRSVGSKNTNPNDFEDPFMSNDFEEKGYESLYWFTNVFGGKKEVGPLKSKSKKSEQSVLSDENSQYGIFSSVL